MRKQTARLPALLFALLIGCLSVLSVSAEGGSGDGSGDGGGRATPLTLVRSSVMNGAEDVDPNVRIVLEFSKNVVHFNVKENNMQCFSVKDSEGNAVPITVEMGDDQVDPDIKRIVTIVPQSPYRSGETYLLTIKAGLKAKNKENVLERDTYISFTVGQSAPVAVYAAPAGETTSTTTAATTAATTTTTKPSTSAASTTVKEKGTTVRTPTLTLPSTGTTTGAPQSTSSVSSVTASEAEKGSTYPVWPTESAVDGSETETETEPTATTAAEDAETAEAETADDGAVAQTSQTEPDTAQSSPKRRAPLIILGVGIAVAAAAAAVIIIKQKQKSKKG